MQTYRAVMLTKRGGPEVLQEVELPLREPGADEVRVHVTAVGAGSTDVYMRRGRYIYAPPYPFVPGYEATGTVEAVGRGVSDLHVGDRVAGLLVTGGYAEKIIRPAIDFVKLPDGLVDDAAVIALILNYVTAYQAMHRVAKVERGQTAFVNGANGGVGTALLELLRDAGVQAYGAASHKHHHAIAALGAIPIEGRASPADKNLRALLPAGVDVAFDALGGKYVGQCRRAVKRGGMVVGYGFVGTNATYLSTLRTFISLFAGCALTGKRGRFYAITMRYRRDPRPFREDLTTLFGMLQQGRIAPLIAARLPLLDARTAGAMLESGGLRGKIVHVRDH